MLLMYLLDIKDIKKKTSNANTKVEAKKIKFKIKIKIITTTWFFVVSDGTN